MLPIILRRSATVSHLSFLRFGRLIIENPKLDSNLIRSPLGSRSKAARLFWSKTVQMLFAGLIELSI